jgi:hypothetical protein
LQQIIFITKFSSIGDDGWKMKSTAAFLSRYGGLVFLFCWQGSEMTRAELLRHAHLHRQQKPRDVARGLG